MPTTHPQAKTSGPKAQVSNPEPDKLPSCQWTSRRGCKAFTLSGNIYYRYQLMGKVIQGQRVPSWKNVFWQVKLPPTLFGFYSQCPALPICPYPCIRVSVIAAPGWRPMPFAYPSMSSSFSSKPLISVLLSWLSQFQLSAFPPRSLLEYQSPNNS